MSRRPRPSITANPEPIAVPGATAPDAPTPAAPQAVTTTPLTLRVPTPMYEQVQREIRRLHYELGASKGAIASALLTTALAHMDEVTEQLSTK